LAKVNWDEARSYWSFRTPEPINAPAIAIEWARNAIDAFVFSKLKQAELTPNAQASKAVWLRRVTFDLTGLPPTPEELECFNKDNGPDA
jgi:Protein of unknown function (DUF1549)